MLFINGIEFPSDLFTVNARGGAVFRVLSNFCDGDLTRKLHHRCWTGS